jgi:hypothetical protein
MTLTMKIAFLLVIPLLVASGCNHGKPRFVVICATDTHGRRQGMDQDGPDHRRRRSPARGDNRLNDQLSRESAVVATDR